MKIAITDKTNAKHTDSSEIRDTIERVLEPLQLKEEEVVTFHILDRNPKKAGKSASEFYWGERNGSTYALIGPYIGVLSTETLSAKAIRQTLQVLDESRIVLPTDPDRPEIQHRIIRLPRHKLKEPEARSKVLLALFAQTNGGTLSQKTAFHVMRDLVEGSRQEIRNTIRDWIKEGLLTDELGEIAFTTKTAALLDLPKDHPDLIPVKGESTEPPAQAPAETPPPSEPNTMNGDGKNGSEGPKVTQKNGRVDMEWLAKEIQNLLGEKFPQKDLGAAIRTIIPDCPPRNAPAYATAMVRRKLLRKTADGYEMNLKAGEAPVSTNGANEPALAPVEETPKAAPAPAQAVPVPVPVPEIPKAPEPTQSQASIRLPAIPELPDRISEMPEYIKTLQELESGLKDYEATLKKNLEAARNIQAILGKK